MKRSLPIFLFVCWAHEVVLAQIDTLGTSPWVGREFRYWRGDPMMHGPDGECIAGFTDEDRRLFLYADHRFQEFVFVDDQFAAFAWEPGYCMGLEGDTVAVLTGEWRSENDTLRVTVEQTALYPSEPILAKFIYRQRGLPLELTIPRARICLTQRARSFWFEGERMLERSRVWD
jgi:hypothetical protein